MFIFSTIILGMQENEDGDATIAIPDNSEYWESTGRISWLVMVADMGHHMEDAIYSYVNRHGYSPISG